MQRVSLHFQSEHRSYSASVHFSYNIGLRMHMGWIEFESKYKHLLVHDYLHHTCIKIQTVIIDNFSV